MNKEEATKLAKSLWATENEMSSDGAWNICLTEQSLLALANACEKIGMEKAAKICDNQIQEYHCDGEPRRMEYFCAEEIRKAI